CARTPRCTRGPPAWLQSSLLASPPDSIQRACTGSAERRRAFTSDCDTSGASDPGLREFDANATSVNENGGAGQRQNRSAKQGRVGEEAEPFDLRRRTRIGQPADQHRTVNDQNEKQNPGAEVGGRQARLPSQQKAHARNDEKSAGQI